MERYSEHALADAVVAQLKGAPDPRLGRVMESLVRHLHGFVREVELTEAEWLAGIQFLTETGQFCSDLRQEFILLSDTLGVSMLVDAINHRVPASATESTVLGPFYRENAPEMKAGDSIAGTMPGEATIFSGRVTDPAGRPLPGALLDVWQAAPTGRYDNQEPGGAMNMRGRFRTDAEGAYRFRTLKPASYPVPMDGPVGRMFRALGRHPYRPAHVHFIVSAPRHAPLTTHLFVRGDRYLDSDAVFAVKNSLIVDFVRHDSAEAAGAQGVTAPFYTVDYDFALTPAG